jgi:hypothetical protein
MNTHLLCSGRTDPQDQSPNRACEEEQKGIPSEGDNVPITPLLYRTSVVSVRW